MKDLQKTGRPMFLSILCVFGFFGCFLRTILVISPAVQAQGRWYAVYVSLSAVIMIICLCGLWLMKKLAFWAFLTYFILNTGINEAVGILNLKTILLNPQDFASFALVPLILLTTLIFYRRLD
jgi:hypothetical protein